MLNPAKIARKGHFSIRRAKTGVNQLIGGEKAAFGDSSAKNRVFRGEKC